MNVSIYHGHQSYTWVKSYVVWIYQELLLFNFVRVNISRASIIHSSQKLCSLNLPRASVFSFDGLDILCASIGHLSEKLLPFEFLESFRCTFSSARYMIVLNHTPKLKVMAISICQELSCSISIDSIYYAPESDIRVKSCDHLNFTRASVVQFRMSQYIMGLNHTPE